ncbi:hypothetical protein KAF25_001943 [Fusarium avenaceum]|uniref:Lipocalin-like domain-containing protein n=1 Tax=Fusarium avenaceum TaxID=40199 RepID=A0A9P7KNS1_9HYPO|nr:hypothetical protein KAF25_001943 [Fusarium avenaceum]
MKPYTLSLAFGLMFGSSQAISMVNYSPSCGVDPDFGPWYYELLKNNEDPTTTSSYTDFFARNGSLIVLGNKATGANAILQSRAAMLPADGSIQWNHFPNKTVVAKDSATEKTFHVYGVMQTVTTADGNCSTTYFQTLFTVAKDPVTHRANLTPQGGSLLVYDGFLIEPSEDPCPN